MKKLTTAILALLYLAVSSGIAVELHYCMGSKAGMEFFGSSNEQCGKCGMVEKKAGCCHDEFKFYKLEDAYKNVSNDLSFTAPSFAVIHDYSIYKWQMPQDPAPVLYNDHAHPPDTGPGACIMNCVFRI